MRPSLRLPATICADPGSRMLRATSHQPRRVISGAEVASGWRSGVAAVLIVCRCSQLVVQGPVLLLDARGQVGCEALEGGREVRVGGGEDLGGQQPGVARAADGDG